MSTTPSLHAVLDELIARYKDNEYVSGRLANYITHALPLALDSAFNIQKQREERKHQLQILQEEFTLRFLLNHPYVYHVYAERFFHYDGVHFNNENEDNLHHMILSSLSQERALRDWKYKIKTNIVKLVKERTLFKTVPEPATIQFVLKTLFPAIFPSRNHAKYFLTVIGDCLFGKDNPENTDLVYFIPPQTKDFIQAFDAQSYMYALPSLTNKVKFKFYDHAYANCRLLYISPRPNDTRRWEVPVDVSRYLLDFLVVAAHYTTRYGSADNYLKTCTDQTLVNEALYLKRNTPESVVQSFIQTSLFTLSNSSLDHKKMVFLWKLFLKEHKLPGIVFYDALKPLLIAKGLVYDPTTDAYLNMSSKNMPAVSSFVHFWNTTILEDDVDELEIAELLMLFNDQKKSPITEQYLLDLIRHFYPDVTIEDNKYILQRKCSRWNKRDEVKVALEKIKGNEKYKRLDDAYLFYMGTYAALYLKTEDKDYIHCGPVSLRYFERAAHEILDETLDDSGLISFVTPGMTSSGLTL